MSNTKKERKNTLLLLVINKITEYVSTYGLFSQFATIPHTFLHQSKMFTFATIILCHFLETSITPHFPHCQIILSASSKFYLLQLSALSTCWVRERFVLNRHVQLLGSILLPQYIQSSFIMRSCSSDAHLSHHYLHLL